MVVTISLKKSCDLADIVLSRMKIYINRPVSFAIHKNLKSNNEAIKSVKQNETVRLWNLYF